MDFRRVHGSLDNSCRDGIHSHAIFGPFYGQGLRRGVQRTLGERCEDGHDGSCSDRQPALHRREEFLQ